MSESQAPLGTIERQPDAFVGRLERSYDHNQQAVWRMLTEADALAQWLAPGHIELRPGGVVRIDFGDSGVVIDSVLGAFDPPRMLSYSWSSGSEPERPLRWELAPAGSGATRLLLTVRVPLAEDASKACAGFEGHLDMLAAALEGVPIKFPFQRYLQARSAYQQMLAG